MRRGKNHTRRAICGHIQNIGCVGCSVGHEFSVVRPEHRPENSSAKPLDPPNDSFYRPRYRRGVPRPISLWGRPSDGFMGG
ncbi:hypothetical protein RKLH11_332 [Rhodobacteraceae bacterium KLH11]|nr:hypothetical protein RKLH11_332 [Rhodobacteraceae bacterium KLH11]